MTSDVEAIARKLVSTFHVDMTGRALLPDGRIAGTLIRSSVLSILKTNRFFPPQWQNEKNYDGGLIELEADGRCRVTWKGEVGLGRYEVLEVRGYESAEEAVTAYASRFYGNQIDGIAVDWTE